MAATKMFISKFAASKDGKILEKLGKVEGDRFYPQGEAVWQSYAVGKEAFLSREEAVKDAKKRVEKKIKSHEKSISALRALTF